jgi:UDP-4-amino-4,6-dideoxy-N-acetyl-beta-L-altrosamine N-acetyltransferase
MIIIDKQKIYKKGEYKFKNFTILSEKEILIILDWRNHLKIRRWMYNNEIIEKRQHFNFINSLKKRDDCFYWLVYEDDVPYAVVSINNINYLKMEGETGFYINPNNENGNGFYLLHALYQLLFETFGVEQLLGRILSSNKYALLNALFLGFSVSSSEDIDNRRFLHGTLSKENYYSNFEKKTDLKNFIKYIKNNL